MAEKEPEESVDGSAESTFTVPELNEGVPPDPRFMRVLSAVEVALGAGGLGQRSGGSVGAALRKTVQSGGRSSGRAADFGGRAGRWRRRGGAQAAAGRCGLRTRFFFLFFYEACVRTTVRKCRVTKKVCLPEPCLQK